MVVNLPPKPGPGKGLESGTASGVHKTCTFSFWPTCLVNFQISIYIYIYVFSWDPIINSDGFPLPAKVTRRNTFGFSAFKVWRGDLLKAPVLPCVRHYVHLGKRKTKFGVGSKGNRQRNLGCPLVPSDLCTAHGKWRLSFLLNERWSRRPNTLPHLAFLPLW